MLQLQKSYPGNETVLTVCLLVVELYQSVLPAQLLPAAKSLQSAVISVNSDPTLSALSLQFITALCAVYKVELSSSCDMDGLAQMLNGALHGDKKQTRTVSFGVAGDTMLGLLEHFSDQQLQNLNAKGVYKCLRNLLKYHDEMDHANLRKVIMNIYSFTCVSPCTEEVLGEGFISILLSAAETVWSERVMQESMYRILSIHCKNRRFIEELLNQNFLLRAAKLFQQECYHASLFRFIFACIGSAPEMFSKRCLEEAEFMQIVLSIANPASSRAKEDVEDVCKLLTLLCAVDSPKLFEYSIVTKIEDCAKMWPKEIAVWGCRALGAVAESLCPYKSFQIQLASLQGDIPGIAPEQDQIMLTRAANFFGENHHLFLQQMLSDPALSANLDILAVLYNTLQNIIIASPQETITRMCSQDFIEFLVFIFIRDTITFTEMAADIAQFIHIFLLRIGSKEELSAFCKANFHVAVVNLLQETAEESTRVTAASLLRYLAVQYNKLLKDQKPLLECQAQKVALNLLKACRNEDGDESRCASNLLSLLLTMSGDKAIAQEMYTAGSLDTLLELIQTGCSSYMYGMLVLVIGCVTYPEYVRQVYLADRKFHLTLLQAIKDGADSSPLDLHLLYSCIVTLTIVACNDAIKNELVEGKCMSAVTKVVNGASDNADICSSGLGLLCSLMSSPLVQKQPSITEDILVTVANIMKGSSAKHDKVIRAAASIILTCQDNDEMLVKIDASGVIGHLLDVEQCNNVHTNKCCTMAIERQLLHLVSIKTAKQEVVDTWAVPKSTQSKLQCAQPKESLVPNIPKAPELDDSSRQQLASLGINLGTGEPLLRIGRVYGVHVGECHSCQRGEWFEEIGISTQGLTFHQYQSLIEKGWFRRGGVKLYHSSCCHDAQCAYWEAKVSVHDFDCRAHKSYVKVMRRIPVDRLTIETLPVHYSKESYDLYNKYNIGRHAKTLVSEKEYCEHTVDSPIQNETIDGIEYGSFHQLYRLDGKLVAVSLIDVVPKGIVSLYMWYSLEKEVSKYSLGVYSALKEIEFVRELSKKNPEMKYYYLQGWNENNKKLAYKANYPPESFYCACITPEWLPSSEAVKEATEKYLREHTHDQNGLPSSNATTPIGVETTDKDKKVSPDMPCSAFENDRAKYQQLTGHRPDVSKMVVCLNYTTYMYLGEVFSTFKMEKSQKDLMEIQFEQMLVAMDPDLVQSVVVDLKAHVI